MSSYIPANLREHVIARAENRCEYCRLSQLGQAATFHIDHVIPMKSGGETTAENLALACVSCSLRKSAKEFVTDPQTDAVVPIFNPRQQNWSTHFAWSGVLLLGKTSTGRATVTTLNLNRPIILAIREEEKAFGRHP